MKSRQPSPHVLWECYQKRSLTWSNLVFNLILFHCILNHDRRFAAAISRDEIQVHEKIFAKMSYYFFSISIWKTRNFFSQIWFSWMFRKIIFFFQEQLWVDYLYFVAVVDELDMTKYVMETRNFVLSLWIVWLDLANLPQLFYV